MLDVFLPSTLKLLPCSREPILEIAFVSRKFRREKYVRLSEAVVCDAEYGYARSSRYVTCPTSSILSGQRQLDFPILFERYQQQSGLWEKWESRGFCGISKGRWEARETCFWFSSLSTACLFPQPGGRRVFPFSL